MAKAKPKAKQKPQKQKLRDHKTFKKLMLSGYLPEVLPPAFTSENWAGAFGKKSISYEPPRDGFTRVPYSATKRGFGRRYFELLHPVSAAAQSHWLSDNWNLISTFCNGPATAPIELAIQNDADSRSISTPSFDKVLGEAKRRLCHARFLVRADIAKFYGSIYTHSIPWALHGKDIAKADRHKNSGVVVGNGLDWAVRVGQSNQTKGIPIGPDFSRIIGEIIGAAIDAKVVQKAGTDIVGYVRNIDDFYIGANDLGSAEKILRALQESAREFELELNDDKTSIKEAHTLIDESWLEDIEGLSDSYRRDLLRRLDRAFDQAFHRVAQSSAESALKYLIRTIDRRISANELEFEDVEHHIVRAVINFPHSLDYGLLLFIKQCRLNTVNVKVWKPALKSLLEFHYNQGHEHESCWILTAMLAMQEKFDDLQITPDPRNQLSAALLIACLDHALVNFDLSRLLSDATSFNSDKTGWFLANEVHAHTWGNRSQRKSLARPWKDHEPSNESFLDLKFMSKIEKRKTKRAIPDRYKRYDEDDFDIDDLLGEDDYDEAEVNRLIAKDPF